MGHRVAELQAVDQATRLLSASADHPITCHATIGDIIHNIYTSVHKQKPGTSWEEYCTNRGLVGGCDGCRSNWRLKVGTACILVLICSTCSPLHASVKRTHTTRCTRWHTTNSFAPRNAQLHCTRVLTVCPQVRYSCPDCRPARPGWRRGLRWWASAGDAAAVVEVTGSPAAASSPHQSPHNLLTTNSDSNSSGHRTCTTNSDRLLNKLHAATTRSVADTK